ncbi:Fc receptor-like protein 2 isoform X1 [Sarcophilus harrisii]|uniref:Fc receptor-like protein 2 isoform X1 n=1 Tax=Sarcophilus harrisii TaxID=9305 RepID=UPI001301DB24|nr:Fc receptor-like protein 2 isoform X1 [Sarcophilus harrisii]
MLLWISLWILVSINGQASAAKKAVVIPSPSWIPVFKGEKVTLTCSGFHFLEGEKLWWFYEQKWQKKSNPLEVKKTGEYRCEKDGLMHSDPVYLLFSTDDLILQTPYSVFEGDTVLLICRGWNDVLLKHISYYKDKKPFSGVNTNSTLSIPHANSDHNGWYSCKAQLKWSQKTSKDVKLQVLELFSPPKMKTTTSEPMEGTPVTLSCETQLPLQRSDTKLNFSFFRDGRVITSTQQKSQVLQIPAIQREDSGSYWCEAETMTQDIKKQSEHVKISVKRIPVSGILLKIRPPKTQVIEGEKLVLECSVAGGTGNITFCWHKDNVKDCLRKKTQYSLKEEFVFSTIKKSDEGRYHCVADNNINNISSGIVAFSVIIPVSRPLLTFSATGMQTVVGNVVELRCEVLRGSAPIFYQFYHKGLILETILAPFGGIVSFNLSVTIEHSGNYSCKANNSFSSQLSEILELSILGKLQILDPSQNPQNVENKKTNKKTLPIMLSSQCFLRMSHAGYFIVHGKSVCSYTPEILFKLMSLFCLDPTGRSLLIMGIMLSLLGILSLTAVVLLIYFKLKRKSGRSPVSKPSRDLPITDPQESGHSNSITPVELQPIYANVTPFIENVVYSEVWNMKQGKINRVNNSVTPPEDKYSSVTYSEVKTYSPSIPTWKDGAIDKNHEDVTENYENVLLS